VSLNLLWTLVNALQVIVHLPLVNISFPINAYITSKMLANVASFDIVPTEFIYSQFLQFDQQDSNEGVRYDLVGMETGNFLMNSGTLLWLLVGWIFLVFMWLGFLLIEAGTKKLKWIRVKLGNVLFFSLIVRILLESYLDLLLTSLINLKSLNWKQNGETMGTTFSLILISFLIAFPIMCFVLLKANFKNI
jgi:hypothetical protein